jgi:hypothetical protein
MVVKREYVLDREILYHDFAGAICKGPCFILIESCKYFPGRGFDLGTHVHNDQNTPCTHQIDSLLESDRTCVPDIAQQQGIAFIQDEVCTIEANSLLYEFLLETKGTNVVTVSAVFDGVPGTCINEDRFHRVSVVFAIKILVMLGGGVRQTPRLGILS